MQVIRAENWLQYFWRLKHSPHALHSKPGLFDGLLSKVANAGCLSKIRLIAKGLRLPAAYAARVRESRLRMGSVFNLDERILEFWWKTISRPGNRQQ